LPPGEREHGCNRPLCLPRAAGSLPSHRNRAKTQTKKQNSRERLACRHLNCVSSSSWPGAASASMPCAWGGQVGPPTLLLLRSSSSHFCSSRRLRAGKPVTPKFVSTRTVIKNPRAADRVQEDGEGLVHAASRLDAELDSNDNDLDLLLAVSTAGHQNAEDGSAAQFNSGVGDGSCRARPPSIGLRSISRVEAVTQRPLRAPTPKAAFDVDDTHINEDELRKLAALAGAPQNGAGRDDGVSSAGHVGSDVSSFVDQPANDKQGISEKAKQDLSEVEVLKRENKELRVRMMSLMLNHKSQAGGEEDAGACEEWTGPLAGKPGLSVETKDEDGRRNKRARESSVLDPESPGGVSARSLGLRFSHAGDEQQGAPLHTEGFLQAELQKLTQEVRRIEAAQQEEASLNAKRHQELVQLLEQCTRQ